MIDIGHPFFLYATVALTIGAYLLVWRAWQKDNK